MSLYILYINEGFFPKRYCVIDRSNNKMVFKTDSKSEVKRWVNSIGLKVLHYHVYDMIHNFINNINIHIQLITF